MKKKKAVLEGYVNACSLSNDYVPKYTKNILFGF